MGRGGDQVVNMRAPTYPTILIKILLILYSVLCLLIFVIFTSSFKAHLHDDENATFLH